MLCVIAGKTFAMPLFLGSTQHGSAKCLFEFVGIINVLFCQKITLIACITPVFGSVCFGVARIGLRLV